MTTSIFTQQLQSGFTLKTLTDTYISGSGWIIKTYESWKGQEATEIYRADAKFFSTHAEALRDMDRIALELKSIGYK